MGGDEGDGGGRQKHESIMLKEAVVSHVTVCVFYVCDVNQESLFGVIAFDKNA